MAKFWWLILDAQNFAWNLEKFYAQQQLLISGAKGLNMDFYSRTLLSWVFLAYKK